MSPRAALALVFLTGIGVQEGEADLLVRQLGHDEVSVRARAMGDLIAMGEAARPALERAVGSADAEVSARARLALQSLHPLRIDFNGDPAGISGLKPVRMTIRLGNPGSRPKVIHVPGIQVRFTILELHEESDERNYGRSGGGCDEGQCRLDPTEFQEVPARGEYEVVFEDIRRMQAYWVPSQNDHVEREGMVVGWAGRYRVEVTYDFRRTRYMDWCPYSCESHTDPSSPWNRCPEDSFRAWMEFTLKKGDR